MGSANVSFTNNAYYGYLRYRWTDANGDHIAQRNEVNFNFGTTAPATGTR